MFEGKREWAARRMLANVEIETLTPEQHEVLAWLCSVRHKLHTSKDSVWNNNSDALKPFDNSCGECEANQRLKEVNLKPVDLQFDYIGCPTISDFDCLSSDEQEEWEEKAEQYNEVHPDGMGHSAISMWQEESWEYRDFLEDMEKINDNIEKYLRKIDETYDTNYCPSGYTRLY